MEKENSKKNKNDDSVEEEVEKIDKPSYTYWKREHDKPFSNDFAPQKSNPVVSETTNQTGNYGSAWNKAGTWEEKHLNKNQFEDFFNQSIKKNKLNINDYCILDGVSSYSGDTYYVFIRGKIKFVYDCEMTLQIQGINDFEEVNGEVKIKEVNNHDLEDDFEFDYSGKFNGDSDKSSIVLNSLKGKQTQIQSYIRKIFDELKENCLQKGS